jgi:hypothetical protein
MKVSLYVLLAVRCQLGILLEKHVHIQALAPTI